MFHNSAFFFVKGSREALPKSPARVLMYFPDNLLLGKCETTGSLSRSQMDNCASLTIWLLIPLNKEILWLLKSAVAILNFKEAIGNNFPTLLAFQLSIIVGVTVTKAYRCAIQIYIIYVNSMSHWPFGPHQSVAQWKLETGKTIVHWEEKSYCFNSKDKIR